MSLKEGDVPGRAAYGLWYGVDRLDGVVQSVVERGVVGIGVVRIHGGRVGRDGGKSLTEHWVTGNHVREACAVAVASGKDPASVDAVACSQIGNERLDEANVVNVGEGSAVRPLPIRIGSPATPPSVRIDHDSVRIHCRIAKAALRFHL